jgi:WhiB family transcriptional regulator, redox-sensing transcriptional regulator
MTVGPAMTMLDLLDDEKPTAADTDGADADDLAAVEVATAGVRSPARCSDGRATLVHLFFSDDEFDIARAKAICARCGRHGGCLAGALERREAYGVWGGELVVDGTVVAVKRGRGRPPKHPRPPVVVDEVPVPPHLVA